jgi:hypothetical protein
MGQAAMAEDKIEQVYACAPTPIGADYRSARIVGRPGILPSNTSHPSLTFAN